jgi:hypothetical protein
MKPIQAETIALQALAWIATDPDRLGRLLAETGLGPDEIRAQAADPAFLGGVLDFLLGDEAALVAFCGDAEIEPTWPARARVALPGGAPGDRGAA